MAQPWAGAFVNVQQVAQQAAVVQKADDALQNALLDLNKVRALNGQDGYTVTVNGVHIAVAAMDSRTYEAKLVRGREMIHLGALKALGARVDAAKETLDAERAKFAELVRS